MVTGFLMKRLSAKLNSYETAYYGSCLCLFFSISAGLGYFCYNFSLNCFFSFVWGVLFTVHRANCFTLYSKHFENNLDMFGVFQFFNAFGCSLFIFLITVVSKISIVAAFLLLVVTFALTTGCSAQFKDFESKRE